MIGSVLAWWAVSSILGLAVLPIVLRLFSRLPDRGYGFSRAIGIMAVGYLLWMGASLGVLRNNLGGALASVLLLVGLGLWSGRGRWAEIGNWLRSHRRSIIVMELLFFVAFALWIFIRSNNPEAESTEKPMELAFLNAILRSERFPPRDPWLSGYAISYYYFGYILLAFLARLTNVSGGLAFNLGNSLWFGLSVLGTYSLIYNLIAAREGRPRLAAPLMGPLFVLITGNLEAFLEVLHARHLFWRQSEGGQWASSFWKWLNLKNLADPPIASPSWSSPRHWWWWRASRVVNDVNLAGVEIEVIDEFPFFSFLLADNHPHLLALPFVLLIVGFALQIYLAGRRGDFQLGQVALGPKVRLGALIGSFVGLVVLAVARAAPAVSVSNAELLFSIMTFVLMGVLVLCVLAVSILLIVGDLASALPRLEFFFGAWLFGGLLFLNTWDYPIYLSIFLVVMWWSARSEPLMKSLKLVGSTAIGLTFMAVLFYLPWYPSFASQAGGMLPNLIFPTRLPQFLVMFATAFIPILTWLIYKVRHGWQAHEVRWLLALTIGLPLSLLLLSWVFGAGVKTVLERNDPSQLNAALQGMGATVVQDVIVASASRLYSSWTALTLGATIALGAILLKRNGVIQKPEREGEKPWAFVVMLIGIGALLVLGPEFFYLKDQFGSRMNTVFKFYFAAWILWGIAAAYAIYELWPRRGSGRSVLFIFAIIPLIMGIFYPIMAAWTKTGYFKPVEGRTLDASAYVARRNADDYAAIQWINEELPAGVIAEAVGGSYSYYARVSTHTGLSTVLGWPGHESQWRGGYTEMGSRMDDIAVLYREPNWGITQDILDRYNIDYVFIGMLERTTYNPIFEIKFEDFMDVIYEVGEVRIYARRGKALP